MAHPALVYFESLVGRTADGNDRATAVIEQLGAGYRVREPATGWAQEFAELGRLYLVQTQYKGFWRALLSTIRHGPIRNMASSYVRVGRHNRRVLLIWGREDRTVPFALSERMRKAIPHAEFHAIEGAAHAPHLEKPDLVNGILFDFLGRK
jgi:pimeloyl-ACP methyl ester carboxylesterase